MDEIRENAMDKVLSALPTLQDSILPCVEICTENLEAPSLQNIKSIIRTNVARDCGDDFNEIQKNFFEKKNKKENVNNNVLIDIITDMMYDGIQLFNDEELAAISLGNP
ncbi:hypothetical protein M9Y10_001681 [Tritrichomonas musculus]|uniref:Uncharacterized protein n=1 Tax=Tritrichomonas musculus TaxID=1915356 RepID=A0ABR2L823_9EUKA